MESHNIGRYEIKAELGQGGMGTVYRAYDPHFKRDVALKVLPPQFVHHPTFRARFEREAQVIASLEHPAIVPVYDFGEQDEQLYFVMRFMPGGSLAERLNDMPLSLAEATRILTHLAPALDEAHAKGIIHRDLKPANILFDQNDKPYVADFGIAKLAESSTHLTGAAIIGTPAYMSPEQVHGDRVLDGRSDIYALGIILFEMLTARKPYEANTPTKLMMKHILDPVPNILTVKADLPSGCRTVTAKAMAKEPDARFQTARAMVSALQNVVQSPNVNVPSKRKAGLDWPSILGVLLALLLLVIGAFLWTPYNETEEPEVAAIAETQSAIADVANTATTQEADTPVEETSGSVTTFTPISSGTQDTNGLATESAQSDPTTSTLPPAPTPIRPSSSQKTTSTPIEVAQSTAIATFTLAPGETPLTVTASATAETGSDSESTSTPTDNNQATAESQPATSTLPPTSTPIQTNDSTASQSSATVPPTQTPPTQTPPTQVPPTQVPPTQVLPTQALPTQALPTQALPTQALPTQALPTQALPTQALPTQALPTQALPTQAPPTNTTVRPTNTSLPAASTTVPANSTSGQRPSASATAVPQAPPTQVPPTQVPPTQVPPTQAPPTQAPPTQPPPTQVPPTQALPTQALPTQVPPTQVPPTQVPPTQVPPTQVPPTQVPPTQVPPTQVPPTQVPPTQPPPPTQVPPTAVPPTQVPPTQVPPTQVPPTQVPPTQVPPTQVPPTQVPPTQVPATQVPARQVPATQPPPPTQPPVQRNVGISLLSPAQNETVKSNEVQFRVQVNGFENDDRLQLRASIDQNNLFNEGVSFNFDGSAYVANLNYQPGNAGFGKTYYWQVVVIGADGSTLGSSGISQFRWEQPGGGGGQPTRGPSKSQSSSSTPEPLPTR